LANLSDQAAIVPRQLRSVKLLWMADFSWTIIIPPPSSPFGRLYV
jgi:hypothetical protein